MDNKDLTMRAVMVYWEWGCINKIADNAERLSDIKISGQVTSRANSGSRQDMERRINYIKLRYNS